MSSAFPSFGTYTVQVSASIRRNASAVFRNVQARSLFRIRFASSASSPFTQSSRLKYARIAGRVLISSNSPITSIAASRCCIMESGGSPSASKTCTTLSAALRFPSRLQRPAACKMLSRPANSRQTDGKSTSTPASTRLVETTRQTCPFRSRARMTFSVSSRSVGIISVER